MGYLIPENLCRLQSTMFVNRTELDNIGRDNLLRCAAERLAEEGLRKLIKDCIKSTEEYMGYQGSTLGIDVYVLSPEELHKLVANARMEGERDAIRWGTPTYWKPDV
jgi:spore coat polysaccharide biosynthesis protein SpsF (cytidylyltransferase family)